MSNSYSQKSSLWALYGKTQMASLWSQLLLHLNSDNLSSGKVYNGEGTCQALCHIANTLLMEGEYRLASMVLQLAKKKFPNEPFSHNWMLCECLFTFLKSLHNGEWSAAQVAATQMATIDKWESCLRLAELHIARCDFQSAYTCVNMVIDNCQDDPEAKLTTSFKIRAMILLAELQCTSASFTVPTSIITVLNSALSFSNLYHLEYLSSIIHMHLANVQLLMGMPSQSLKILDKNLVQILSHGGRYDIARAMLLYVKCIVADAGNNTQADRCAVLLEATELLKKVKDDFHKVEARARVKDVLYLQAQLYNEIEHIEDRNDCALEYKQYHSNYPSKTSKTLLTSF